MPMPQMSLLKFRPRTPTTPPRPPGAAKYGLYPLGEDVLMSTPTFEVVLHLLANGTHEDRQELCSTLQRMYQAPFSGVLAATE